MSEGANYNGTDWGNFKYSILMPFERESSRDFNVADQEKFNAYEFMQQLDKSCFNYFALSKT